MKEPWIVFYDSNGRELCSVTVRGIFPGEIGDTISLLAYENEISVSEISFAEVTR